MNIADWLLFAYVTCLHLITWWHIQKLLEAAEDEEEKDPDKTFTEIGATHMVQDLKDDKQITCDGKGRIAKFKGNNGENFVAVMVPEKSWTRKLRDEIAAGRYIEEEEENSDDRECDGES